MSIKEQIVNELDRLTPDQQQQILTYAKQLVGVLPSGTSGNVLLNRMDSFHFEPGAVDEMLKIIEADCERIDWDGWQ
jgi:hypothetical protein